MENSGAASSAPSSSSSPSHAQAQRLHAFYRSGTLTDVELVVAGRSFRAHRVVLAAASPYFYALFTSGLREASMPRIELHELDAAAVEALLHYMYLGELAVTGETLLRVLHTANQLEMLPVVALCCRHLMTALRAANCLDIYLCCTALQVRAPCRAVADAASAMVATFVEEVARTETFRAMDGAAVVQLAMAMPRHAQQQRMLKLWIQGPEEMNTCGYEEEEEEMMLGPVSAQEQEARREQVRLAWAEQLLGAVCSDLSIENGVSSVSSPTASTSSSSSSSSLSILGTNCVDDCAGAVPSALPVLLAIGGFNDLAVLSSVECLDLRSSTWREVAPMHERRSYCGVAVLPEPQHVLVVGGACATRHLKSVERYDPVTNVWETLPPMRRTRSYLGVACMRGQVYAVGGFNGVAHLSSVERFDPTTQRWDDIAPLRIGRSGLALVVLDDVLYAIGGYDGHQHLASIECYDPDVKQWTLLPQGMRVARNGPAAVALPHLHRILVSGGESRHGLRMQSCELYDPADGKWEDCADLPDARSGHASLGWLDDCFAFALGGSYKKNEYVDDVHRYDALTQQWALHSRLHIERCGLSVVELQIPRDAACLHIPTTPPRRSASRPFTTVGMRQIFTRLTSQSL